jgi:putative ABC transport system permease protein
MKFWEITEGLRIALKAIKANKMRAILTTLGIVIGIVSVTLMATAIEGMNRAFSDNISKMGSNVLYIQKFPWFMGDEWWRMRNRKDLTLQQANALKRQTKLCAIVSPSAGLRGVIQAGDKRVDDIVVNGVDENFDKVGFAEPSDGRFLSSDDAENGRPVVVLSQDIAEKLFPHEEPLGKTVKIRGQTFVVIGLNAKQGNFLGMSLDNRVFIPIKNFIDIYGKQVWFTINAKVADGIHIEDAKEEVRGIMRKVRHLKPIEEDDFAINQQELLQRQFDNIFSVIYGIGLFITGMSLFVGAIGIMNIMFVSVTERTKEIGIRKALGAKRRTILFQFLIEAASICLLGGLIGLAIATPLSFLIDSFLPTSMPPSIVVISLLMSIVVGVISGMLPAYRAAKLDPVEALRYE